MRVGFENNLYASDGSVAADNSVLVRQAADGVRFLARPLGGADDLRALYS